MSKSSKIRNKQSLDNRAKTRLLLHLWYLDGLNTPLKQSELTQQIKLNSQKAEDYQTLYQTLEEEGIIDIINESGISKIILNKIGLKELEIALKNLDFAYRPQQRVRTKDFNALLKWIREFSFIEDEFDTNNIEKESETTEEFAEIKVTSIIPYKQPQLKIILSYQDFQQVVLEIYKRINYQEHLEHFVPIYYLRRQLENRVSRPQFDQWMLQMQQDKIFQLLGADSPHIEIDKLKDSLQPPTGNLRYYARLMNAEVYD